VGERPEEIHQRVGTIGNTLAELKEEKRIENEKARNIIERLIRAVTIVQQQNEDFQTLE